MFHVPEKNRILSGGGLASTPKYGNNGAFLVPIFASLAKVIASDGMDWEHVSVSFPNRCPTWDEMSFVKSVFWDDEDCVMQLHPPKSNYVNCHPHVLHLWRPLLASIPQPPSMMVGPKL